MKNESPSMTKVTIKSITITDIGFVVFLCNSDREDVLPIFIGPVEAQAISMILMNKKPKRPMTHDLLKQIIDQTDFNVLSAEITDFTNETFFATLKIQKKTLLSKNSKKNIIAIDSRPSDAIAVALRINCPIFVATHLFDEHGVILQNDDEKGIGGIPEEEKTDITDNIGNKPNEHPSISKKVNHELGVYKKLLQEAITEERFEDAIKIRNKIENITQHDN